MLLFLLPLAVAKTEDKLISKIYHEVAYKSSFTFNVENSFVPCVNFATGNKITGCSSDPNGNNGELVEFKELADADPYTGKVVLMKAVHFTRKNLQRWIHVDGKAQNLPKGILLDDRDPPSGFSPDKSCPNSGKGLYKNTVYEDCQSGPVWNQQEANNLLEQRFMFPIFRIGNEELLKKLESCYVKTKSTENKCHVEMISRQYIGSPAIGEEKSCLKRNSIDFNGLNNHRCDPFRGQSIVHFVNGDKSGKIIWINVPLDSKSFFYKLAPRASIVTSWTIIIGIIDTISRNENLFSAEKRVIFSFLNGESYDYIGSTSLIQAIKDGKFPPQDQRMNSNIKFSDIEVFVDFGEFTSDNFTFHVDKAMNKTIDSDQMIYNQISKYLSNNSVNLQKSNAITLPPSTLQVFKRERTSLPGFFIGDFDRQFNNVFYSSRFDNQTLFTENIVNFTSMLGYMSKVFS